MVNYNIITKCVKNKIYTCNLIFGIGRHPDSTRGQVIVCEQALLCCGISGEAAIVELEKLMDMALSWFPFLLVCLFAMLWH